MLNREPYATDLEMTPRGFPVTTGREPIYDSTNNVIGYKGNGWKYENGTLTLKSGEYDFNYTKPKDTASERYSYTVECSVVVNKGAAITGGKFSGDTFSNSGTVKDVLIKEGQITNNGTLSCLFGLLPPSGTGFTRHTMTAVDGSKIYYTVNQHLSIGGVYKLYFTGTPKFTVRLENSTIHYINGEEHYGGLTSPDGKGYQTFTPPEEEDIVLNREPYATDLVITEGGFPDTEGREPIYQDNDPTKQVIGCKGNGWKYEIGNVSNTLTLESGSYDFTNTKPITKDGDPLEYLNVDLIVNEGVTITGGIFWLPVVSNSCTIQNSSFLKSFENHGGTVTNSIFLLQPTGVECCTLSAVDGSPITFVPNYPSPVIDYIICNRSTYYFTGTPKFTVRLENSTIHHINGRADYGGLKKEPDSNYYTFTPEKEEDIVLNDTISRDPAPAYTLTVTGGGLVNGKTSAEVEAGDKVCLTVGEGQDGMSFNYWDLPTALTQALTAEDSTFSNKVEPLTFTMPDLSEYTEDTRFTIRLDIRPAELPDDDDGPSVLGTMATVAVGGAAAGILVWQGVSLGVDSYLQLSLPDGVAVPTNRIELVKLLWETAGKPDVVLPALYGDISAEDGELQKATRWAIDNGLVKPADETDASRFDPDRSVSKYEVARAWFKVKKLMK